jgi:hypothetical protein
MVHRRAAGHATQAGEPDLNRPQKQSLYFLVPHPLALFELLDTLRGQVGPMMIVLQNKFCILLDYSSE